MGEEGFGEVVDWSYHIGPASVTRGPARDGEGLPAVAYLVNQYPAPSHTFIRREILALEALGFTIHRFAHRPSAAPLLEAGDMAEARRTRVLSTCPVGVLVRAVLRQGLLHPILLASAGYLALRLAMWNRRPQFRAHCGYLGFACALADAVRNLGIAHLHAHMATNAATVALLCHRLCGVGFSFTVHGTYELVASDVRRLRTGVREAAFVIAVSDDGRARILEACPEQASSVHLVRCGLDADWFDAPQVPCSGASQLVSIARLDDHKDPLLLLRAISDVVRSGVECRVVFVGDGSLRPRVEQSIRELRLGSHVSLAGWRDQAQVQAHLRESRALVLSSRTEGLPVAIMEAFALGRPVIAPDVGGVRELVTTGETGWLFAPGDVSALSDAMRRCLEAPRELLDTLGHRGKERVRERHDVRRSAAHLGLLLRGRSAGGFRGEEPGGVYGRASASGPRDHGRSS